MLDEARQFAARTLPEPVTGQTSWLNIHWMETTEEGKKFWGGRACKDIDEFIKTLGWALKTGNKDIYACMSSQARAEEKVSKKGNSYMNAIRSQHDVVAIKSLFIDVDVKEGAYPDTQTALNALGSFCDKTGMPTPSAVVLSGSGGFHVHWSLETPLGRDEWQELSNALSMATQENALMCDTQCTIDSARILRIPETVNLKNGESKPVELLMLGNDHNIDVIRNALMPYIGKLPVQRLGNTNSNPDNDELGAGLVKPSVPILIQEVAKHCGFVSRTLGTGGIDNPNPLWFMSASLATFVEEGRDAFHMMSDKYPSYDALKTNELYDRVVAKQKQSDLGWPKCAKIAGYGAKECQTCPLLKQNKSPLNFVLKAAVNAPDQSLPEKYIRDGDGIIHVRGVADDGSPISVPISHYPITSGWLSNSPWTLHFNTRTSLGKLSVVEVPFEVITAKDSLSKFLGSKGLVCSDRQYKVVKEFFVSWLQKLQTQKDSVISASPFGWSVVDGKIEGFAYGGRVWTDNGDRPAANSNPVLMYQYTPKGDPSVWNEAAKVIYDQNRPALNAILAVAFAGPLVRFTGHPGLMLNAYSTESGIGKTTTMRTSQAVWAHPVLGMQALNDTANSVLGKMGQLRSLPMYWDEIKSEQQTKQFCSIVFNVSGGREKTRMTQDAQLRTSGTWQTIMVSASNESLVDPMAREVGSTTAGLYRLFEYAVPKPQTVTGDVGAVQRLVGKLEDNYGHAGLLYSKFLGANHARIEREVAALQDEIYNAVGGKQDERMWIATMAVILKGAEYANEMGLTIIDIPGLHEFLLTVLDDNRREIQASPSDMTSDMSVSSILAEFLNSTRSRNTLFTNRIWAFRGKPAKNAITIQCDTTKLGEITVQIGKEDKIIRISSTFLTRWMAERGYSRQSWIKKMEKEFGLKIVNGKLGGGTDMVCAMEYLIELDGNNPKLEVFLE